MQVLPFIFTCLTCQISKMIFISLLPFPCFCLQLMLMKTPENLEGLLPVQSYGKCCPLSKHLFFLFLTSTCNSTVCVYFTLSEGGNQCSGTEALFSGLALAKTIEHKSTSEALSFLNMQSKKQLFSRLLILEQRTGVEAKQLSFASQSCPLKITTAKFTFHKVFQPSLLTAMLHRRLGMF